MSSPLIGVTVLPEYLQSETGERVLDHLIERAGVNAVATSPYVMEPVEEGQGGREPPIDAGAGSVRLLDRPLWGKRELWVRTAPSFAPNRELYRGLRYQPAEPNELTRRDGAQVAEFLDAAKQRGLKTYFQIQSAIPPGYRVQFGGPQEDDIPRLPDGSLPTRRVANNGSLASPHIREYQTALLTDLLQHYPQIQGLRVDWPEYPPYLLDSAFVDFSEHARQAADRLGFDFETMRQDAAALYQKLHGGLTDQDLQSWLDLGDRGLLESHLAAYPGVLQMLRLKAKLSQELLQGFRRTLDEVGGEHIDLAPSSFPSPWSLVSGMDLQGAADCCQEVSVKLYGMHWAMMLHFYGRQLLEANPRISESLLTRALVRLLDIDDEGFSQLDSYRYPEPDQPHPIGAAAQRRKIEQARSRGGPMAVHVLAHGYGPLEDFRRRIRLAAEISPDGFWVNRYGYLSDDKLDAIGEAAK